MRKLLRLSACLLLLCLTFLTVRATTYTASGSGNWSSSATWGGVGVPTTNDVAIIPAGITVTIDAAAGTLDPTYSSFDFHNPSRIEVFGLLNVVGLGTASAGVYFENPLQLEVYSGGEIEDNDVQGSFNLVETSTITVYTGGRFSLYQVGGPGNYSTLIYDITKDPFVTGTGVPYYLGNDLTVYNGTLPVLSGPFTVTVSAGASTTSDASYVPSTDPSSVTTAASGITTTTGTLNATVGSGGNATSTIQFQYSTNATLSSGVTTVAGSPATLVAGSGTSSITAALTGLSMNTTYYYRVSATNSLGTTQGNILSFTTLAPAITLSPTSLPDGTYRSAYSSVTFSASGGTAPYTYSAAGLPPGMSINANTGVLSGTPTAAGTYSVAVTATDASTGTGAPFSQTNFITLVIDKVPLTIQANPASKNYGAALPTFTASYSGFVGTDNAGSLTTAPTLSTAATAGSGAGTYPITVNGAVDPNYSISYIGNTLTVSPVALTVTASNETMVYGGAFPALNVSYSGFVNGDNASSLPTLPVVSVPTTPFGPVGSYVITPSGAVDPNYTFTYVTGTLTITPAPLTITASNTSRVYGSALPALTASYSGFRNGDNASNLTTQPTLSTAATAASPVGTYPITVSGAVDANYTISYVGGLLTVGPATLTVTADNKIMPLGGPLPALTVTYSGFVNGEDVSVVTTPAIATTPATAGSPTGNYTITASGGSAANYTFSYVPGTLTVQKAILTITAVNASSTYGSPLVPNGSLTVSYSGFINGDNSSSLTVPPTVINTAFVGAPAGTYALIPSGAVDPNYTIVYVDGTYTINQANLNIQGNNETMTYGGTVPTLGVTYTGLVNGDGPSSLSVPPVVSTTATSASLVGTYPIAVTGAFDPNYNITFTPGTMTIGPAPLTITAASTSMTYGGTVPALSATYSGFVNGDNASSLTTQPVVSTSATSSSPMGTYPITASGAVDPNYSIAYVPGVMTVTQALLTVTADNQTMPFGGPMPTLTVSYSGFVNGDNVSSLTAPATASTTATLSSPAGPYPITPSGASAANYSFSYVSGTLTINKPILTITADPGSSTYGSPLVPNTLLSVSYSGFVNGDDPTSLTIAPTVSNAAFAGAPAGNYTLTPSGAVDPNYTIVYVNGTYTIDPANLSIQANNGTMTYGGTVPALSATYTGLVNGDNASSLSPDATLSTTATSASPAGTYPITASGAVDANYTITYVAGTMTVAPASLAVMANAQTKVYGTTDPSLTYAVSGLVNGDNTGVFTGSLTRDPGENVGTYPITQGTLSAGNNYVISFTGNTLTITKASQQITWAQSLLVGCDGSTQVTLTATASSGLPVTYTSSNTGVASVAGAILTLGQPGTAIIAASQPGDGNYEAAADETDTLINQSAALVREHWGDVLIFDNSSNDYVQWQWYKDGSAIAGATGPFYSETPALNGQYYVIATDNSGAVVQTCVLNLTPSGTAPGGIKVFPNPVNGGSAVTVTCDYAPAMLQGATLQVVDISGKVWQTVTNVQPSMQVTMPAGGGIYIINLVLSNGQKASVNVLVTD
ncbi:MAG TPA: MBG domain-containing protein [Puia sp.]|nr:MBG domain-containing protein [Puia sp.]